MHVAVCSSLLTWQTPQSAAIPMITAASSGATCHSSSSQSLSSRNAVRQASASEIPDTIVVRWVPVLILGACIDARRATGVAEATLLVDPVPGAKLDAPALAANLAFGARLRSYRFDKYRTTERPERKPSLSALTVTGPAAEARLDHGELRERRDARRL